MYSQSIVPDAYPSQLLDDYLAVAARRHSTALYATALRTRSVASRQILARAVSDQIGLFELLAAARGGGTPPANRLKLRALTDLAGVIALQEVLPEDPADGLALYDMALRVHGPKLVAPMHQAIHTQLALRHTGPQRAAELLREYSNLPEFVKATVELDLANPFAVDGASAEGWLAGLAELLPAPAPRLSTAGDAAPFDRLTTDAMHPIYEPGRVSVIVSAYHPDAGLLTSVKSLLAQSWSNLEVLVVDDGSPPEYDAVLTECAALDSRVAVIRLPENSGTYTARNTACDAATGDFITFHDSDDWAHPQRIAAQVQPLRDDPTLMATISHALTVSDQLLITKPGRSLRLLCTPSLMFRKDTVMGRLGYFDGIRKAADTEYLRRIKAAFGAEAVLTLDEIYTLMRQGADSLSRAEFRAGWKHPARVAYQSAYQPWHARIKAGEADPFLDPKAAKRPFDAPKRFARERPRGRDRFDVILACDWRPYGGPQKSMLAEIAALTGAGHRVAVMHLESFRHMTEQLKPLCQPIQDLINSGVVAQVLPTDEVDTALLVVRYPPVLQFRADETSQVRPRRLVILANQAPSELDGSDLRYVPSACSAAARQLFDADPLWYPQGPAVRAALEPHLDPGELAVSDMPGIIDDREYALPRTGFRSSVPVLGRHSRDDWTKWPADAATLLRLYPDAVDVDVRIMGGAKAAMKLLGHSEPPTNWIVYRRGELEVRNFLFQLDFYVHYPHPNMIEAFGRAILEALASGCVTILPKQFQPVFGDAALYAEPGQVPELIAAYRADLPRFLAQSRLAQQRVRENFSHRSYLRLIAPLLEPAAAGVQP